MTYHHVSPQFYGALFGADIVGIMMMNQLNARLIPQLGSDRLMRAGTLVAAIAGLILALDARTDWGGLTGLVVPIFVMVSITAAIVPNSLPLAPALFPEVPA